MKLEKYDTTFVKPSIIQRPPKMLGTFEVSISP